MSDYRSMVTWGGAVPWANEKDKEDERLKNDQFGVVRQMSASPDTEAHLRRAGIDPSGNEDEDSAISRLLEQQQERKGQQAKRAQASLDEISKKWDAEAAAKKAAEKDALLKKAGTTAAVAAGAAIPLLLQRPHRAFMPHHWIDSSGRETRHSPYVEGISSPGQLKQAIAPQREWPTMRTIYPEPASIPQSPQQAASGAYQGPKPGAAALLQRSRMARPPMGISSPGPLKQSVVPQDELFVDSYHEKPAVDNNRQEYAGALWRGLEKETGPTPYQGNAVDQWKALAAGAAPSDYRPSVTSQKGEENPWGYVEQNPWGDGKPFLVRENPFDSGKKTTNAERSKEERLVRHTKWVINQREIAQGGEPIFPVEDTEEDVSMRPRPVGKKPSTSGVAGGLSDPEETSSSGRRDLRKGGPQPLPAGEKRPARFVYNPAANRGFSGPAGYYDTTPSLVTTTAGSDPSEVPPTFVQDESGAWKQVDTTSDPSKKKDVSRSNEIEGTLDKMAPGFTYEYKDPADSPVKDDPSDAASRHAGVMADKVEESPLGDSLVAGEGDDRKIRFGAGLSFALGAAGNLHARLKEAESRLAEVSKKKGA